ncbi:MAG: hypothetical protein ACFWT7_00175 [Succiniclasticum sp.]
MRLVNLEVKNFRGIKELNVDFPIDLPVIFLIGAGDSTKSTVLTAISWLLWPSYYLEISDIDFYLGITDKPIEIRGSFIDFPKELIKENRYGLYLRKPGADLGDGIQDEPERDGKFCLTIQLTVDNSLEPVWNVVCNRLPPKQIPAKDRRKFSLRNIGENYSKDMVWGRSSILNKYVESQDELQNVFLETIRKAAHDANFGGLDSILPKVMDISREYGVHVQHPSNKMIMRNGKFSSEVGLFDDNVPLSLFGTGTRKLLSMGLNIDQTNDASLLLIDELEIGLEPYRLKSVINHFRKMQALHQIIVTTHSPVALAEANYNEVYVVHSDNGVTSILPLPYSSDSKSADRLQANIRRRPQSFFAKKLIVCEGKTEIGLVRAFDTYLEQKENFRLSFYGVDTYEGEGDNVIKNAVGLKKCGYAVCVLMDNDKEKAKDEKIAAEDGIQLFRWNKGNASEDQIFEEASPDLIAKIVNLAQEINQKSEVVHDIKSGFADYLDSNDELDCTRLDSESVGKLSTLSKDKKWFKRIDKGEKLGDLIFNNMDNMKVGSHFVKIFKELKTWAMN